MLGYGVLFVVFDTQATLFEVSPGVSLWYPSAGLNLALVLIFGARYTPVIFIALVASGLWIAEPAIPLHHLILPNLAIAAGNGGIAWFLRRTLKEQMLATPGSMVRLVGAMAALAAWNGALAPASYFLTGFGGYTINTLSSTAFLWWVGDWAGMLTLTPLLLLCALLVGISAAPDRWAHGLELAWPRSPVVPLEVGAQVAAVILSLYAAFELLEGPYLLYLCFLPVLWMALRHGLVGGACGVLMVNLGAVVVLSGGGEGTSILGLQLFILALALTGLIVGALVSERQHAIETLYRALKGGEGAEEKGAEVTIDDDVLQAAHQLHLRQQQLAADAHLLERQNQRKDQLFAVIAHDLQGAVGTAAGLANVVETEADSLSRDVIETFGERLGQSIERLQRLLDSLLEWTRMRIEGESAEWNPQAVEAIVDAAVEDVVLDAEKKDITLERRVESSLRVHGHAAPLRAVMRNLLSNAIKFTGTGGRIVVDACAKGEVATICVRDSGVGISPEEVGSLFEPGEGVLRTGTEGEQGAGLGLVLCRQIVEQHGGEIWAESNQEEGTNVCFTLPRSESEVRSVAGSRNE